MEVLSVGRTECQFDQIVGNQYLTSHPAWFPTPPRRVDHTFSLRAFKIHSKISELVDFSRIDSMANSLRNCRARVHITTSIALCLPVRFRMFIPADTWRMFFNFTEKRVLSTFQEHGWDCVEAVELTKWTRILAKCSAKLLILSRHTSPLHPIT